MSRHGIIGLFIIFTALWITPAYASDAGDIVEFHGFGGWAYGQTNYNNYLAGNKDGNYDNFNFALAVSSNPVKELRVNAQVAWIEENNENNANIDYAFAEWHFADALNLRIGKVKQPFGIYNEVYDVGTMRPFFYLPQSNYGPAGFATKAYKGLGITGSVYNDQGWGVEYDLYGGSLDMTFNMPYLIAIALNPSAAASSASVFGTSGMTPIEAFQKLLTMDACIPAEATMVDVAGGRIVGHTPFNLSLGVSARTGKLTQFAGDIGELVGQVMDKNLRSYLYGVQLEYIYKILTLRSEYYHSEDENKDALADVAYGELSLRPIPHWEIAGRYEWLKYDFTFAGFDMGAAPTLADHQEWAAGLNYWFNSNMVLKFSYHNIYGNRFAVPETLQDVINDGLKKKTQLVLCGAQFSF